MTHSYPYRLSPTWAIFGIVFFGACATLFIYLATTTEAGMIINGVIELGPTGAT